MCCCMYKYHFACCNYSLTCLRLWALFRVSHIDSNRSRCCFDEISIDFFFSFLRNLLLITLPCVLLPVSVGRMGQNQAKTDSKVRLRYRRLVHFSSFSLRTKHVLKNFHPAFYHCGDGLVRRTSDRARRLSSLLQTQVYGKLAQLRRRRRYPKSQGEG